MDTIHKRIKIEREKNNWTQLELAEKIGYSSATSITKLEKGLVDPPTSKIKLLADIFNVSVSYLMGWDNEFALSKSEKEMIEDFRKLSDDEKEVARNYIYATTQISQMRGDSTLKPPRKNNG